MLSSRQDICWALVPTRGPTPTLTIWALCKGMHVCIKVIMPQDVGLMSGCLRADSVLDIKEVDDLQMIRLRNPWGADSITDLPVN